MKKISITFTKGKNLADTYTCYHIQVSTNGQTRSKYCETGKESILDAVRSLLHDISQFAETGTRNHTAFKVKFNMEPGITGSACYNTSSPKQLQKLASLLVLEPFTSSEINGITVVFATLQENPDILRSLNKQQ